MTLEKTPSWESRLWSYVSSGDGERCPLHYNCQDKVRSGCCLDDCKHCINKISAVIDDDQPLFSGPEVGDLNLIRCVKVREIFGLTEKLAGKYLEMGNIHSPPVPAVLIALCAGSRTVEIREVPLRVYHGAIWRIMGKWVIYLNENDTPAKKRFSLFHEAFHILAHTKTTPVFRKIGIKRGSFNELLADHFAGCILMPPEWAKEKWAEFPDIGRMAETFEIPRSIAWLGLKNMGLSQ